MAVYRASTVFFPAWIISFQFFTTCCMAFRVCNSIWIHINGPIDFTGFIKGHGFGAGALATSDVWETSGITVVGANEEDMALAVNRIYELGGGVVLYVNGQMQAELPLPIAGLITRLSMEETAQRLNAIQRKAETLGFPYPNAALTLATLTTPAIPFLRISEDGLVDVRRGQGVELLVS